MSKTALNKKAAKAPGKPGSTGKPAKKQAAKPAAAKTAAVKKSAKPAPKPTKPAKPVKLVAKAKPAAVKSVPVKASKAKHEPEVKVKKTAAVKVDAKAVKPVVPAPVVKPVTKILAKKPGENETPGDADSPLLDMSDVGVRKMIARAKQRGYVTYDELNKVLPSDKTSSEQIEDTMAMLNEMGINVIESEEAEEGAEENLPAVAEGGSKALATTAKAGEQYDRTDDPVRMYLREMGSVELLSREGEIAIAKRIEAGRELMIGA
ncbi:MAG: RNA polymerase sigma factor region1.1 domain-containing protein, partial [Rhizomicrobium sp.]